MDRRADFRYQAGHLDYTVAWVLLTFLGIFGIHRFYMGKWITGIIYLLTGGLVGLGLLYDLWTLNGQVSEINRRELFGGEMMPGKPKVGDKFQQEIALAPTAVPDLRLGDHAAVVWDAGRQRSAIDLQRRVRAGLETEAVNLKEPSMKRIRIAFIFVGLVTGLAHGQQVVVTPEETDEILANPGMGWQTFHRTSKQDKNLPSWIPSTVHYARWGWRNLEPQPGKIDYAFLDGVLKESSGGGADTCLSCHVLFHVSTPAVPSQVVAGYRRKGRHHPVRQRSRVGGSGAG